MTTLSLYNQEGKAAGTIDVNADIFGVKPKNSLIHQVYVALMANRREAWANTKDRSEVRGGGKKPWRQKGTGRARHGSIRSPIWKGGGVTFGPLSIRNYVQKINKKMNKKAVRMCLSAKVSSEKLFVVDGFTSTGKTKEVVKLREGLPVVDKSVLVVAPERDEALLRATRNIPATAVVRASDVNVVDLLHHQYVVVLKGALPVLEERLR